MMKVRRNQDRERKGVKEVREKKIKNWQEAVRESGRVWMEDDRIVKRERKREE